MSTPTTPQRHRGHRGRMETDGNGDVTMRVNVFRTRCRLVVALCFLCLCGVVSVAAQDAPEPPPEEKAPIVEKIEIVRNQFLQKETFLYYISTKPGDRFDEIRLR